MKKIACILSSVPFYNRAERDAIEMCMAFASFDFPPTLFFVDHGVLQVVKHQNTSVICQKSISDMIKSLPLFDIEQIYICQNSLNERSINTEDIVLPYILFKKSQLGAMLSPFNTILTF